MNFATIVSCVLVAFTFACVLVMLASLFAGRTYDVLRSAGASLVMAGITVFVVRQVFDISLSGVKGIGWIAGLSGDALLMMYVIGGVLIVLGALGGMTHAFYRSMTFGSSQLIMGKEHVSPSRRKLQQQLSALGKRVAPRRTAVPANGLKREND